MSENYLGIMMRILSPHNYGYRIMVTEFYHLVYMMTQIYRDTGVSKKKMLWAYT